MVPGIRPIIWSWLGILIYVGWRFEWKFATAAVIALVHDTLFSFGVYALSRREINLATVAAIMTIIGFSVNDTIVIFDRVRDNVKFMRKTPFMDIVNLSVNQCLSRTALTTLTVLFGSFSLLFFGGAAIADFAFILTLGFLFGTYSTVFVASALVVDWRAHK